MTNTRLIRLLLANRLKGLWNSQDRKRLLQTMIFAFFSLLVLLVIWKGTELALAKFDTLNEGEDYQTVMDVAKGFILVGNLLKERILAMVLMAMFFMLIFSNILNGLSTLFLSKDSELLLTSPVRPAVLFDARVFETIFFSSWMSFFFFAPILLAYSRNYHVPVLELLPFLLCLIPFVLIPGCIGVLTALFLGRVFPVHKSRKVFNFLLAFFMGSILLLVRVLQPEKLFTIRKVEEIDAFVQNLSLPLFDNIPPTWLHELMLSILRSQPQKGLIPAILLFGLAILLLKITRMLGHRLYLSAYIKSQEARSPGIIKGVSRLTDWNIPLLSAPVRALFIKDVLLFVRQPELWSQTFLLLALVALYLYNLHLMRIDQISLYSKSISQFIAFLNTAFVGFISTSISMRLLFPSLSLEGPALWILKTAPYQITGIINFKVMLMLPGLLIMAWFMTYMANWILAVPAALHAITLVNITVVCVVNAYLAVCMGTIFPQYKAENVNKIFMSYGGTFYMVLSLGFIALFQLSQSYAAVLWYRSQMRSQDPQTWQLVLALALIAGGLFLALAFCRIPLKFARKKLMAEED